MLHKRIRVTIDKLPAVLSALKELESASVLVGIPEEKDARKEAPEDGQPLGNAALLYIHNYGAPEANIPARPVMEPGIIDARPEVVKRFRTIGDKVLSGAPNPRQVVERGLHGIGLVGQRSVRNRINEGPFQPLSERTIYNRQHRKVAKRKGTKPLVDTGQMRNAVTYVVRRK